MACLSSITTNIQANVTRQMRWINPFGSGEKFDENLVPTDN